MDLKRSGLAAETLETIVLQRHAPTAVCAREGDEKDGKIWGW